MKSQQQRKLAVFCISVCVVAALAGCATAQEGGGNEKRTDFDRAEFVELWGELGAEIMEYPNEDEKGNYCWHFSAD